MGLFSSLVGGLFGSSAAKKNRQAAADFANQTQFNPFGVNLGGMRSYFSGDQAIGQLDPSMQSLQDSLFSGAGGFLGNLNSLMGSGGIDPFLASAFGAYNMMSPSGSTAGIPGQTNVNPSLSGIPGSVGVNPSVGGAGTPVGVNPALPGYTGNLPGLIGASNNLASSMYGQAANPMQLVTGIGDQFNSQAGGFLGQLGSFDPSALAANYTNQLRSSAAPMEQRAAESMAQSLFNSGRLGTTGGQGMFGELINQQNQADIQRQIAGMQYAGQEQSRMAGLAGQFGQLGTNINQSTASLNDALASGALGRYGSAFGMAQGADQMGFDRALGLNEMGFNRGMALDQTNYDRAMLANTLGYDRSRELDQENYARALTGNTMGFDRALGLDEMNYNRALTLNDLQFNRNQQRAQQRFTNAMQLFGGGQQNMQNQANLGMGMLSGAMGIDQNLLNTIMSGAQMGAMKSGVNLQAFAPLMQGRIAENNTKAAGWGNFLGSAANLMGWF